MEYLNAENWHLELDIDPKKVKTLQYRYHFRDRKGAEKTEWGNDRLLDLSALKMDFLEVRDFWNEAGAVENVYFSQPFQQIFFKNTGGKSAKSPAGFTHIFKVKAPVLQPHEAVCLLGHGIALRNWDIAITDCLSPPVLSEAQRLLGQLNELSAIAWGGYPQAERQRFGIARSEIPFAQDQIELSILAALSCHPTRLFMFIVLSRI
jgi:hypothetical protein